MIYNSVIAIPIQNVKALLKQNNLTEESIIRQILPRLILMNGQHLPQLHTLSDEQLNKISTDSDFIRVEERSKVSIMHYGLVLKGSLRVAGHINSLFLNQNQRRDKISLTLITPQYQYVA